MNGRGLDRGASDDSRQHAVTVLHGPSELIEAVGAHLGYSDWVVVTAERVQLFASATGDHRRLHVGAVPPTTESHGGAIAHENLVLSLSNMLLPQILEVRGFSAGINTGTDRVRFFVPVPVGRRVRAGARLSHAIEHDAGVDIRVTIRIELDGDRRVASEIESRSRWLT